MHTRLGREYNKIYNTALYTRLSLEDKKEQGNSIEGQISILTAYINENLDMRISGIYTDNGYSGGNFNRPQFAEMMEDIKKGDINCIIVKDLSRLGRNYLEVMDYIEQVFPLLNVRFISVNDNIDTFSERYSRDSLLIALKSLVNEMYLQDITDKSNSSFKTMQEKGWYIPTVPPYGYVKAPDDKHKLVIDEEAAKNVRQIFQWTIEGMSKMGIAKRLDENGVLSPQNYFFQLGIMKNEKYSKKMCWKATTINQIQNNRVYIGDMVCGRIRIKNGVKIKQTEEDQIIVEGTHEAIIKKEDFYKVRELLADVKRNYNSRINQPAPFEKPPVLFKGIIYCGHCGHCGKRMYANFRKRTYQYSATYICYDCTNYRSMRVACGFDRLEKAYGQL